MYADGNHHGCGYEPSDQPDRIDTIRSRLAARTPFERVMDELEGKRWTHDEVVALKAKIDAGMKQQWEYCPIAASIESCPVATYICVETECKYGCSLAGDQSDAESVAKQVLSPNEVSSFKRLARLFRGNDGN